MRNCSKLTITALSLSLLAEGTSAAEGVAWVDDQLSENTHARIRSASIECLPSDRDLVIQSDYILSIVPPRDALRTATRVAEACKLPDTSAKRQVFEALDGLPRSGLYYIELNAIPARLAVEIGDLMRDNDSPQSVVCHYLDGGIIGAPPSQNQQEESWKKPSLVLSGSIELPDSYSRLAETLNMKLVSPKIGAASTLKLSFAALTKGLTALSILSFSTAQKEALLPELLQHLDKYSPSVAAAAGLGITGMPPKAYRWVDEMRGIGEAFDTEGQWDGLGTDVYGSFAEIYRTIAEDTILGQETPGNRVRGLAVEDAADIIASRKSID